MRDKTLVNIRHSLCQKQNPVERPAETIDAILSLRPIFWHKAANHFDNPHLLQFYASSALQRNGNNDTTSSTRSTSQSDVYPYP